MRKRPPPPQEDSDESSSEEEIRSPGRSTRATSRLEPEPQREPTPEPNNDAVPPDVEERLPLEVLLSAAEEGDHAGVVEFLKRPDAHLLINKYGYARRIVWSNWEDAIRGNVEWGHPETLTMYRGDTALRYASFHGYLNIVETLLAAGAVPALRNDDAKSSLQLAEAGKELQKVKNSSKMDSRDVPQGDPAERSEVIRVLKAACATQWLVVGCTERQSVHLNGRIADVVGVSDQDPTLRLVVVNDSQPTRARPYYEKSAVTSAFLTTSQLLKLPPPPPPAKSWPGDARFTGLPKTAEAAHSAAAAASSRRNDKRKVAAGPSQPPPHERDAVSPPPALRPSPSTEGVVSPPMQRTPRTGTRRTSCEV